MDIQSLKEFEAWWSENYDRDDFEDVVFSEILNEYESNYIVTDDLNKAWSAWQAAKAQAVPEGFGLFDGDTLTYSNGYSINCSFDDEFDCHIFDVYQNEDCVKDGMTQLEQAHCLVLSMIKLDAKDSMIEAQEQK